MTTVTAPLVGMRFYPPAQQVVKCLPAGAQLTLVPDPENPYDEKAIKVFCLLQTEFLVSQCGALQAALEGTGFDVHEMLMSSEPLHLGHIADSDGAVCAKRQCPGNREVKELMELGPDYSATLQFSTEGMPEVFVDRAEPSDG